MCLNPKMKPSSKKATSSNPGRTWRSRGSLEMKFVLFFLGFVISSVQSRSMPRTAAIFGMFDKSKKEEEQPNYPLIKGVPPAQHQQHQHPPPRRIPPPRSRVPPRPQQPHHPTVGSSSVPPQQRGAPPRPPLPPKSGEAHLPRETQQQQQQPPEKRDEDNVDEREAPPTEIVNNNKENITNTENKDDGEFQPAFYNPMATADSMMNNDSEQQQQQQQQQDEGLVQKDEGSDVWGAETSNPADDTNGQYGQMPPPPGYLPPPNAPWDQPPPWFQPPPTTNDAAYYPPQQQQGGPGDEAAGIGGDATYYGQPAEGTTNYNEIDQLRYELDDVMAYQHDLLTQIQNLTTSIGAMQAQEDLYIQDLDVMSDRLVEAETNAAAERNAALEYATNCTRLDHDLALLRDELDEWKSRCGNLEEVKDENEERIEELKDQVRMRSKESEELATHVENAKIEEERNAILAKRKERKTKNRGFFAWLFGLSSYSEEEEEEDRKLAQELAKSTLLRALQTERNNVDELEAAVSILQQNNSAISEMVASRDSLINELNDRVAVFEEDKLVLKAALRQLQKEMKEEAPRTQKLLDDLARAEEEIKRLKNEIESMLSAHQSEVSQLQVAITNRQSRIVETESNLTMIGTYVDKLEDRLGDFALARREIDVREKECKKIEAKAKQMEQERDELQVKAAAVFKEQDDIKKLLEDLAIERAKLHKEKTSLQKERDELVVEKDQLQGAMNSLEVDLQELEQVLGDWKTKVTELEIEMEDLEGARNVEEQKRIAAEQARLLEEEKVISLVQQRIEEEEARNAQEQARLAEEDVVRAEIAAKHAEDVRRAAHAARMAAMEEARIIAVEEEMRRMNEEARIAAAEEDARMAAAADEARFIAAAAAEEEARKVEEQTRKAEEDARKAEEENNSSMLGVEQPIIEDTDDAVDEVEIDLHIEESDGEESETEEQDNSIQVNEPQLPEDGNDLEPELPVDVLTSMEGNEKPSGEQEFDGEVYFDSKEIDESSDEDDDYSDDNVDAEVAAIESMVQPIDIAEALSKQSTATSSNIPPPPLPPPELPIKEHPIKPLPLNIPSQKPRGPMGPPLPQRQQEQKSNPFRKLRKAFAKTTGLHGFFSNKKSSPPANVKKELGTNSPPTEQGPPPKKTPLEEMLLNRQHLVKDVDE